MASDRKILSLTLKIELDALSFKPFTVNEQITAEYDKPLLTLRSLNERGGCPFMDYRNTIYDLELEEELISGEAKVTFAEHPHRVFTMPFQIDDDPGETVLYEDKVSDFEDWQEDLDGEQERLSGVNGRLTEGVGTSHNYAPSIRPPLTPYPFDIWDEMTYFGGI